MQMTQWSHSATEPEEGFQASNEPEELFFNFWFFLIWNFF